MPIDWESKSEFVKLHNRIFHQDNSHVTSTHVDRFIAEDPVHGANFASVRSAGKLVNASFLAGGATGATFMIARTRSVIGGLFGFVAGGVSGYIIGDGVATFTHGLHKFNPYETNRAFYDWAKTQK